MTVSIKLFHQSFSSALPCHVILFLAAFFPCRRRSSMCQLFIRIQATSPHGYLINHLTINQKINGWKCKTCTLRQHPCKSVDQHNSHSWLGLESTPNSWTREPAVRASHWCTPVYSSFLCSHCHPIFEHSHRTCFCGIRRLKLLPFVFFTLPIGSEVLVLPTHWHGRFAVHMMGG